jgi:hypothetical protein
MLNNWYFRNNNEMFKNDIMNLFQEMNDFQTKLFKHPNFNINKDDSTLVKNMKRWMKMIIFETVHEDAVVFLPEAIISNTLKPANVCYPFESPNITCNRNKTRVIRKFFGPGAATLAVMMTKFRYTFFEKDIPLDIIVGASVRTDLHVSVATIELIKIILDICKDTLKFNFPIRGLRSYIGKILLDETNTEKGIRRPLQNMPKNITWDTNLNEVSDPAVKEINEYIKSLNDGLIPEEWYAIDVSDEYEKVTTQTYSDNYELFTTKIKNNYETITLPITDGSFNVTQYKQNCAKLGVNINDINIKNVKEIQPKIDLTVLNKWRTAHTAAETASKNSSSSINVQANDDSAILAATMAIANNPQTSVNPGNQDLELSEQPSLITSVGGYKKIHKKTNKNKSKKKHKKTSKTHTGNK